MDMTLSQVLVFLALLLVGLFGLWFGRHRSSDERGKNLRLSGESETSETSEGRSQRERIAGELRSSSSALAADDQADDQAALALKPGDATGGAHNAATVVDADRSNRSPAHMSELGSAMPIGQPTVPVSEPSPQTQSLLDAELARGSEELKRMVELNQSMRTQQRDSHPLDSAPGPAGSAGAAVGADASGLGQASSDQSAAGHINTGQTLGAGVNEAVGPAETGLNQAGPGQTTFAATETQRAATGQGVAGNAFADHAVPSHELTGLGAASALHNGGAERPESTDSASERSVTNAHLEHERQSHRAQRRSLEARLQSVEQERDEALRERNQHLDALRDRDAAIVTLKDEAAHVIDLQDKLAQVESSRTTGLNERQRAEDELRDAHLDALERLEEEQEQQLVQKTQLESRATAAERERDLAQRECEKALDTLRTHDATIRALNEEASRGAELQTALAEAEIALATTTTEREQSEEQLRGAHEGALRRLQETEHRISELESALAERDAVATRDERIAELERAGQSVQQLESELAQRKSELARAQKDTDNLTRVSAELEASRVRVNELSVSLSAAETAAADAGNTDLELRRVRSELAALESQHASAALRTSEMEKKELDSNARDKNGKSRLTQLESDLVLRNQRIAELEQRLADAAQQPASEPATGRERADKPSQSASVAQAAKPRVRTPLFKRPQEQDDLKMIKGVGPVMEDILNELGITTFKQIAGFKPDDIARVAAKIGTFSGRIERDDWVGGAKREHEKKYSEPAHS